MANVRVKNGVGADAYLKATGAGTDVDPFVPVHALDDGVAITVEGPLTDAELRAEAIAVTGPLTNTQLRAQSVPVTGPLTNTELRNTPVEVTGPLTKQQLDASTVQVTGSLDFSPPAVQMLQYTSYIPVPGEGDLDVVGAPGAGLRIVVDEIFLQNETDTPCVVLVKSGLTIYRRVRLVADGDYVSWLFVDGKEIRLPTNAPLTVNLAGLTQLGISIRFRYESVS